MISHKYKFIYIHIPKTAGVSIYNVFKSKEQNHKKLDFYEEKYIKDYFKFAFVRNPWDRFLSSYFYFKKGGRGLGHDFHSQEIVLKYSNFRHFVYNFKFEKQNFKSPHFLPQSNWTHNSRRELLLDFVGRYENLQDDFNVVCEKIGRRKKKLPHKNKSKHKDYREYYCDDMAEIIGREYSTDINLFKYEF
jgi:chondroitin 4-sulfotransferase 11